MTNTVSQLKQAVPAESSISLSLFFAEIWVIVALFLGINILLWWAKDRNYLKDESYERASSFVNRAYASLAIFAIGAYVCAVSFLP